MERVIYLLFTRSDTVFSRLIYALTDATYTHVSLGLEEPVGPYYSFARRIPDLPLPAGFVQEELTGGFYGRRPEIPCALYALDVSEESYQELCEWIGELYTKRDRLHYDLFGSLGPLIRRPISQGDDRFCSRFVAEGLLQTGAVELELAPAVTRPMDLCGLEDLRLLYQGTVGELCEWEQTGRLAVHINGLETYSV